MDSNSDLIKIKRGYLERDFEFFHIKDRKSLEFDFHYHDFNKINIFISGDVNYIIEGRTYRLKPWDMLFVSSNDVHKPVINSNVPYERIVIYVNSKFLEMHNRDDCNLLTCFEMSSKRKYNLLRIAPEDINGIKRLLLFLEEATRDKGFGSHILKNSLFIQLVVYLNRLYLGSSIYEQNDMEYDERIGSILDYINGSLSSDLSVENIASRFYMNKYYLMHRFKTQTGYTLHNYIQKKRLIFASSLIKRGISVMEACIECGFGDYSSFVRAFKNTFGLPPKKYYNAITQLETSYKNKYSDDPNRKHL